MSNLQIRKIFGLLKSLGKDSEWLHDMLPEWTNGKTSLKELTDAEAQKVIDALEAATKIKPYITGTRTEKQKNTILWMSREKLKWDDEHLKNFIRYTTGDKDNIDELKIAEASAVITGLKNNLLFKNSKNAKAQI